MGKGRAPCCDKDKVKRGPWSPAEDLRLITFIQKHGHENWRALPKLAGLLRCGKSCRLRWINYLRPDVKRGNFTKDEEDTIIRLHQTLGNKWSKIASHLDGRTDNEIKNVWNTHLKKRLASKNVDVNPQKNASKESSITSSSSSSSSITTIVSSLCVKKRSLEIDQNQWQHEGSMTKKPRDEEFAMDKTQDLNPSEQPKELSTSSTSSNNSNITCSNLENRTGQGFKFMGLQNNTWEEVNKPDNRDTFTLFDIPFDSDLEFWDMLDNLESFQADAISLPEVEDNQGSNFTDENNKWLLDYENELAMEITNDKNMNNLSKEDAEPLISDMYDLLLLKPDVDMGNTILQDQIQAINIS